MSAVVEGSAVQSAVGPRAGVGAAGDGRGAAVHRRTEASPSRVLLLGTGTVGRALVERHARLAGRLPLPPLGWIANSRGAGACHDDAGEVLASLVAAPRLGMGMRAQTVPDEAAFACGDIVVDATASDGVAGRHASWLRRGVHVVTANKLGSGADQARAHAIVQAQREAGAVYGDAATVGAGLPLLRSIRELVRGGDRILAVEGVLSGSLAWLFHRYDDTSPFSACVREAQAAGYTEPDPRIDLSGEDVRRKLLILARAAGLVLAAGDIEVDSLLPAALAGAPAERIDAWLPALDMDLRRRFEQARVQAGQLRFVGRFAVDERGRIEASVGLRALPAEHALCGGSGADNRVAISSDRYRTQPLVIQGPGAGAEVTAAALLDDVLAIAEPSPGRQAAHPV